MTNSKILYGINFLWFQAIWWLVVLLQTQSVAFVVMLLILWFLISPTKLADAKLMVLMALIGSIVDSILIGVGLFTFTVPFSLFGMAAEWLIPLWLMLLWAAFAGTLNHSLAMFKNQLFAGSIIGALCAPLSYLAGAKFGAVNLGLSSLTAYFLLSAVWFFLFPISAVIARYVCPDDKVT